MCCIHQNIPYNTGQAPSQKLVMGGWPIGNCRLPSHLGENLWTVWRIFMQETGKHVPINIHVILLITKIRTCQFMVGTHTQCHLPPSYGPVVWRVLIDIFLAFSNLRMLCTNLFTITNIQLVGLCVGYDQKGQIWVRSQTQCPKSTYVSLKNDRHPELPPTGRFTDN